VDDLHGGLDVGASINDSGQIAFGYHLVNGTYGIAVATPTPEPAGGVMFFAAASWAGWAKRRRRATRR
jgi:hypothetical protein